MRIILNKIQILAFFILIGQPAIQSQSTANGSMARLMGLRDDFISRIKAAGYSPPLPAPVIICDNPFSFGRYEDSTNILHSCDWATLPTALQHIFSVAVKEMDYDMSAERYFQLSIQQWVFMHELGHWWRACQQQKAVSHYDDEMAANRIAAAYWRERDNDFLNFMIRRNDTLVKITPNPVPAGKSPVDYFNEQYGLFSSVSAYKWYQANMILQVAGERPALSFAEAIQEGGNLKK
jgi:hypothetical protein